MFVASISSIQLSEMSTCQPDAGFAGEYETICGKARLGAWEPGSLGGSRESWKNTRASTMLHADFLNFLVNLHDSKRSRRSLAAGKPRIRAIGVGSSDLGDSWPCHRRPVPVPAWGAASFLQHLAEQVPHEGVASPPARESSARASFSDIMWETRMKLARTQRKTKL